MNNSRHTNSNFNYGGGGGVPGGNDQKPKRISGSMRRKMVRQKLIQEGSCRFIKPSKRFSKFIKKSRADRSQNFNSGFQQHRQGPDNLASLSSFSGSLNPYKWTADSSTSLANRMFSSPLDAVYPDSINPCSSYNSPLDDFFPEVGKFNTESPFSKTLKQLYQEVGSLKSNNSYNSSFSEVKKGYDAKQEVVEQTEPVNIPEDTSYVEVTEGGEGSEDVEQGETTTEPITKIKVAIIDGNFENELSQKHYEMLQAKILETVDNFPGKSPPQFIKSFFAKGTFYVVCANEATVWWLTETVRRNRHLWEGANLLVAHEFPKRERVLVRVPSFENPRTILKRLAIQNPGLLTWTWAITSRSQNKKVQTLFLSIDSESFATLQMWNMTVYYGLGRVVFKNLKDKKKKGSGNAEKGNAEKGNAEKSNAENGNEAGGEKKYDANNETGPS